MVGYPSACRRIGHGMSKSSSAPSAVASQSSHNGVAEQALSCCITFAESQYPGWKKVDLPLLLQLLLRNLRMQRDYHGTGNGTTMGRDGSAGTSQRVMYSTTFLKLVMSTDYQRRIIRRTVWMLLARQILHRDHRL